ncbi:tellurite resistance/C4-dicarboxylate transporter family protein [Bosea sp. (in: a-proteobacteria)]|uniref:tellurite resistance/C4-dicarboxylate transporter family protein n=1 Tax=Bosea sp. (in: a-proteobacteria) TaxID=1871050 RepID=UPI002621CAF3|nr:tellurite resistance/C4-dicarboxylate transporter family protein [Bosea sp. (in: a-proteobacteria)]MCO5090708.1 tellurite resistance/C4-dicarboxylate transporter family protein [Bosea sp. (in: a-proteobacteria)]
MVTGSSPSRPARSGTPLADLSPAYFGLVMATGIVSLAAFMMGHASLAFVLFYLNIAQYLVLCCLYALRAFRYPGRFFGDMVAHRTGPGYFTAVAGTGVLASQFMVLRENVAAGAVLWLLALLLWFCLTYTIFTAFTVKREKPPLDEGISGSWLLAVVATQALSVSSALLAARLGQPYRLELNLLSLSMWLWGGMLYIWMMSLIFYRYAFFRFLPSDLAPPYWINMGAMAISTLAGSLLILNAPQAPYLMSLLPFLKGFTVFYWATGTWWIPMLLLLGIWRHGFERFPFEYDPLYWGAVFPLGMYAASTWQLDHAMEFGFLSPLPRAFLWIALTAWAITFIGMVRTLVRSRLS